MKILTYNDYLNSSLNEIYEEINKSFTYTEKESQNFILFMDRFAEAIGKYEEIIKQIDPSFISVNKTEKCKDTLNRYKEKARDIKHKSK